MITNKGMKFYSPFMTWLEEVVTYPAGSLDIYHLPVFNKIPKNPDVPDFGILVEMGEKYLGKESEDVVQVILFRVVAATEVYLIQKCNFHLLKYSFRSSLT